MPPISRSSTLKGSARRAAASADSTCRVAPSAWSCRRAASNTRSSTAPPSMPRAAPPARPLARCCARDAQPLAAPRLVAHPIRVGRTVADLVVALGDHRSHALARHGRRVGNVFVRYYGPGGAGHLAGRPLHKARGDAAPRLAPDQSAVTTDVVEDGIPDTSSGVGR